MHFSLCIAFLLINCGILNVWPLSFNIRDEKSASEVFNENKILDGDTI